MEVSNSRKLCPYSPHDKEAIDAPPQQKLGLLFFSRKEEFPASSCLCKFSAYRVLDAHEQNLFSTGVIMNISAVAGALVPIFLVILSGTLLKRCGFPGPDFWPAAERLTYFLLFPALLFASTATASLGEVPVQPLVAALIGTICLMTVLLYLLRRVLDGVDLPAFSSLFQGSIRFNTYVGFAVALVLFGATGLTLASVTIAVLIPLVNLLSVTVLVRISSAGKGLSTLLTSLVKTPPFLACVAGISINMAGIALPGPAVEFLQLFGRASLPLGLLAVGAGLTRLAGRASLLMILTAMGLKLIVLPALMWSLCRLLAVDDTATVIAVLFAALPGSASSYILARQMGGDSQLMAGIVTAQITVSLITLPVVLSLVM